MPQDKAGRNNETHITNKLPQGINYLLVIAIDSYVHCPRLYNCVKDAHDLIELLTERYRFERNHIKELYEQQATKQNIYRAFREMAQRVTPNDNLLIYFSGHGEYDKVFRQGYWIPVDAEPDHHDQYIPNSEIKTFLSAINSHHTFLMSDSCFAGALFAKGMAKNIEKRYERDPSRWGLTAGRNEIVSDGKPGDNSPFAESLLYRLRQNTDALGVAALCNYVTEYVQAKTKQTPIGEPLRVDGHKNGQFVFHLKKDEARDWAAAAKENSIDSYERFLLAYPNGAHAEEARAAINDIQEEYTWRNAKSQHTIFAYETYLSAFPKGRYRRQAIDAQRAIEEAEAWSRATRRNTIPAYREFQENYPNSQHFEEANDRIQKRRQRHQPKTTTTSNGGFSRRSTIGLTGSILVIAVVFFTIWNTTQGHKTAVNDDTKNTQDTLTNNMILGPELPDSSHLFQQPTEGEKKELPTSNTDDTPPPQPKPETKKPTTTDNNTTRRTEPPKETNTNTTPTIDQARVKRLITDAIAFLKAGLTDNASEALEAAQKLDSKNTAIKDAILLISIDDINGAINVLEK